LTDDLTDPAQFNIPTGTTLAPRAYLLVWADNDRATNGQLHANFRLAAEGETIALLAPDRSVVDSVTFTQQTADISFGRLTDGGSQIGVLVLPTPGASNAGIDPSAVQFMPPVVQQNQIVFTWPAKAGETYRVEYKNSLEETAWTLLRTVTTPGTLGETTDTINQARRFYRLSRL
jgi:hypothetical protein